VVTETAPIEPHPAAHTRDADDGRTITLVDSLGNQVTSAPASDATTGNND
jgi:hypothetical protein